MNLNVDILNRHHKMMVIALSHYYEHPSVDMIADPDITIAVYSETESVEVLAYQDCFGYRSVYSADCMAYSPSAKKKLNSFRVAPLDIRTIETVGRAPFAPAFARHRDAGRRGRRKPFHTFDSPSLKGHSHGAETIQTWHQGRMAAHELSFRRWGILPDLGCCTNLK